MDQDDVDPARSAAERRMKGLSSRSEARVRAKTRTSTPAEGKAGLVVVVEGEAAGTDAEAAVESRRSR
jgi:hypothetical protein